jgi:hypothetical protein
LPVHPSLAQAGGCEIVPFHPYFIFLGYDFFKDIFSQVSYPFSERVHTSKQVRTLSKLKIQPLGDFILFRADIHPKAVIKRVYVKQVVRIRVKGRDYLKRYGKKLWINNNIDRC